MSKTTSPKAGQGELRRPAILVRSVNERRVKLRVTSRNVLVNARSVGTKLPGHSYPGEVEVVEVVLSNGYKCMLLHEPLPVNPFSLPVEDGEPLRSHQWFYGSRCGPGKDEKTLKPLVCSTEGLGLHRFTSFGVHYYPPPGWNTRMCFFSDQWDRTGLECSKSGELKDHVTPGKPAKHAQESNVRPLVHRFLPVQDLQAGDVITWEHAFTYASWWQHGEQVLSNGQFGVPVEKPTHAQHWAVRWHEIRWLRGVSHWENALRAMDGCYYQDVFSRASFDPTVLEDLEQRIDEVESEPAGEYEPREHQPAQCFSGYPGTPIGYRNPRSGHVRFCWRFNRQEPEPVVVVDSPDFGACYVFLDPGVAEAWASGEIPWEDARQLAEDVIFHVRGWEKKIEGVLGALGIQKEEPQ